MHDLSSATDRARWLAEVSAALDEAMILIERMGGNVRDRGAQTELMDRIEEARLKTRTLRLRRHQPIGIELSPKWIDASFEDENGVSPVD